TLPWLTGILLLVPAAAGGQTRLADRLPSRLDSDPAVQLVQDRGLAGLHDALARMATTASVMQTTAHPDDEDAGVLTWLARGLGVRTSLLTLNRGEGGANAIGPELFDGLGMIRTEELLLSGRYYGLAAQYFTTAVDYGFSKTLDEALRSWDRERLLEDMVRAIRLERPLVVISRFHGSERDGHGHHQTAGRLTPEAVGAAADPDRFPSQITREGLRPWRVRRVFRGGVSDGEPHDLALDPTGHALHLGESYDQLAAYGLSLQRSQTSGRIRSRARVGGTAYELLSGRQLPSGATGPLDGIPTGLADLFRLTGESPAPGVTDALLQAAAAVAEARAALHPANPDPALEALFRAARALREALDATPTGTEAHRLLAQKVEEGDRGLRLALGATMTATTVSMSGGVGAPFRIAPGDSLSVRVDIVVPRAAAVRSGADIELIPASGWSVRGGDLVRSEEGRSVRLRREFRVEVPLDARPGDRVFDRASPRETMYQVSDSSALGLTWGPPPLVATARLGEGDRTFRLHTIVRGEEPDLPRGFVRREIRVVDPVSVEVEPRLLLIPENEPTGADISYRVRIVQAAASPVSGSVALDVPEGWRVAPDSAPVTLSESGESREVQFRVTAPAPPSGNARVRATFAAHGRRYTRAETPIRHRDLEVRSLFEPAESRVVALDLSIDPGLSVGYVMGVGDRIPEAIRRLGVSVAMLDPADDQPAVLGTMDAVVIGTRAYAVRPELESWTSALNDFVHRGGHLIVLYQTQEFDPRAHAPLPAVLPPGAEEVSEEDAKITILAPEHPLLTKPHRISGGDFDGWVEQRGSKFFSEWDPAYTPLVETHDQNQAPQRGIWLTAPYGQGHYTYIALALHRQTPYG
ncbi:MAG: PIG-L family deacetylase, partial [Gemmatimonadota bacterium]|nr:PIG-L family deacetylase [Gemmatimonadota bacterium]